jgi:hypothetical protein
MKKVEIMGRPNRLAFRKRLPPEVSSDWHQMIAKALYLRLLKAGETPPGIGVILSRDEIVAAADTEFEYGWDGDSMVYRPVADTSIPGEHPAHDSASHLPDRH